MNIKDQHIAKLKQIEILRQGVETWNKWRNKNVEITPDLSEGYLRDRNLIEADLSKANLRKADLRGANLHGVDLGEADLSQADLSKANLSVAKLIGANLIGANLCRANLRRANLCGANLWDADLSDADLRDASLEVANLKQANLQHADLSGANLCGAHAIGADLRYSTFENARLDEADFSDSDLREVNLTMATMVETNLENVNLSGAMIYGISAWNLKLKDTNQSDLIITKRNEPLLTVDNLELAQFIYLLLNNEKIRDIINTIGEKGVLILGRFTEERKAVLDAIRKKLRELGFVPMMFDFEKPTQRDFTETIKTLAGMSRFIIADITNPKSSPLELQAIMPDYMIPFVPIIQEDEKPFAMFQDLQQKYREWVLDILKYDSPDNLLKVMDDAVVKPALVKADQLLIKKAEGIHDRHVKEYLK